MEPTVTKFFFFCICTQALCKTSGAYSVFDSLGKVMTTAGDYMNALAAGAEKVAMGIQTIENMINDVIDEDCQFYCSNGAKPKKNPHYIPNSNGCGSLGLKWETEYLPLEQLSKCCDKHDLCYDICNKDKENCDKTFKSCLYKICDKYKKHIDATMRLKCKGTAKLMYTGTMALGCYSYREAQSKACICESKPNEEL